MAAAAQRAKAAAGDASAQGSEEEGEDAAAGSDDGGDEAGSRQQGDDSEGEGDAGQRRRRQGGSASSSTRRNNMTGAPLCGDGLYDDCDGAAGGSEAGDLEEQLRKLGKPLGKGARGAIGPLPKGFGRGFRADDELNLAGLLNVLDGVVDTPGRIIVMTSNHPEKLDPALIRPGRINKKVYMGRLRAEEALAMVRHYYAGCSGGVGEAQEQQLRRVLREGVLSPAELESLCAEYDSVAELAAALAAHPALAAVDAAAAGEAGL